MGSQMISLPAGSLRAKFHCIRRIKFHIKIKNEIGSCSVFLHHVRLCGICNCKVTKDDLNDYLLWLLNALCFAVYLLMLQIVHLMNIVNLMLTMTFFFLRRSKSRVPRGEPSGEQALGGIIQLLRPKRKILVICGSMRL